MSDKRLELYNLMIRQLTQQQKITAYPEVFRQVKREIVRIRNAYIFKKSLLLNIRDYILIVLAILVFLFIWCGIAEWLVLKLI